MNKYSSVTKSQAVGDWFKYHFLEKKCKTWFGFFVLGLFAIALAYTTVVIDFKISVFATLVFLAVFVIVLVMKNPYIGLFLLIIYSAFPSTLMRFPGNEDIPFSVVTSLLVYLTFFSVLSKYELRKRVDRRFWANPISIILLVILFFYLLQAANPNMGSLLGWLSFTRIYINFLLFFYVAYALLSSWNKMRSFIYFGIVFTTLLAIYACKQQWFGYAQFEMNYIIRTRGLLQLLLQWGLLRKFSTLSDPSTSGILFSSVALQCIILFLRDPRRKMRIWLSVAIIFNMFAYGYSGTRTATLMIVAGIVFYSVATLYEKRTLVFVGCALAAFTVLMTMPFSPPSIGRIRSTFGGTKDASAIIRNTNRHKVQPYLYEHPMGGGIFTSITESEKYNPDHYLSTFPPDGGYMKVFAEQGWIGLALLLISYFIIMTYGLNNYYKAKNPEIQNHYIALLTLIFTLMVGQYSQLAMNMEPQVYFYLAALIFFIKLPNYDKKEPRYAPY
jgi:putative inorganic carbon (hco3(-)) transporter